MIARADAVAALAAERFDVLVIGGGITGAGVALDAATRGYSVGLVEQADFAAGTSSRSSKLVHGGLRYLQNFDLGLVREALLERQINVHLAPHLVKPLAMVVPGLDGARPDRMVGIGLNMYDAMARRPGRGEETSWSPERHRLISGAEVVELMPALGGRSPSAGYLFYDCQTDDVRLVLTILGEAERFGAVCAGRLRATGLLEGGGATVRDELSGETLAVAARNVVNATGVWADRLRPDELHVEAEAPVIRPSRGSHVIVPSELLEVRAGMVAPAAAGKTIFILPWLGRTLIGTTDNDYDGALEHVKPPAEDVAALLDATNSFCGSTLGVSDVVGAYAGVRPLISTGDPKKSVDISRKAELYETSSGLVTITGGKLTTWRRMAKLAVDRIVEREGREAPCRTQDVPLGMAIDAGELPRVDGVGEHARERLAARYGHHAHDVLALASERPALAAAIVDGQPDLLAEAAYAARREQALTLGDVLLRRTRLGLLAARELLVTAPQALARAAAAMGGELGWDAARQEREVAAFRREAELEGLLPAAVGHAP